MILLLPVAAGIVYALWAILNDTQPAPTARTSQPTYRCTITTCPLEGELAINGWLMCTTHYQAKTGVTA